MKMKKGMALGLIAAMALNPMTTFANEVEEVDVIPISAPIENKEEVEIPEYIHFEGVIESIEKDDDRFAILIKDEGSKGFEDYFRAFVTEDVVLLSDETLDFADQEDLKEGTKVSIYYNKNTIMTMIYPPQLAPDVVIINESKDYQGVVVSKFDDKLLSAEGDLYIQPGQNTTIVDVDGNEVEADQLYNKDLIAFYDTVRESYPAQTGPEKIIMMPVFNLSKDRLIEHNGVQMIPLRYVAESLGYEVKWNGDTRSVELTKGVHWHLLTIGKDSYNFAKMHIELGEVPILHNSRTYVPLRFFDQVLRVNVQFAEEYIKFKY